MKKTGPIVSWALVLGVVFATPVSATTSNVCSRDNAAACLDGVSTSVTALDNMRLSGSSGSQSFGANDDEGALSMHDRLTGQSAGADWNGWSVWGGYNRSDFESSVAVAPYDAVLNQVLFGADNLITDRVLAGVALGYENLDADTPFNGGGQQLDGFSITPYVAVLLSDVFSVDFAVGYTHLSIEQDRIDPANAATLSADIDGHRFFSNATLNAVYPWGDFVFGARAGLLYAAEFQDGYKEVGGPSARTVRGKHLDLGQAFAGVDVAYIVGDFEPYAMAMYRNDLGRDDGSLAGGLPGNVGSTTPADDDEVQYGLGLRYFASNGITANVEWTRTIGRALFDDDTLSLQLRMAM